MATASNTTRTTDDSTQMMGSREGADGIGSPITNEAYNVIAALHEKLEGLEAYRKYAKDGKAEIWKRLTQTELDAVQLLATELERLVSAGEFQLREPGRANA